MMLDIPNVLSADTAQQIRQSIEVGSWSAGARSAGGRAAQVKKNQQLDADSSIARQAGEQILHALRQHPLFMSAALPNRIYPPMFNSYEGGETYGAHVDNAMMPLAPTDPLMRTDVSATLFLTNADQYDGGELVVQTPFGDQEVKLDAGDLIVYPSTSLHTVQPVTRGKRICAVFWIESLIPETDRRTILFDLDQIIQSLSFPQAGSGNSEVARLTGVYHNLIRLWSRR